MANWSNPTLTSTYTNFLAELKARDEDLALQFDGTTSSNLANGTIRWSSTANRWQKWNGTSWAELTSTYALTGLSTTGNATIGGTLGVTGATTLAAATATTPATGDNSTAVATTAYVRAQAYAPLASPAITGTPTVPTAAADTNTTQAASTAFVVGQASSTAPIINGTAAVGTSLRYSRQDHVHPTDTSRAALASPTFTGTPAAPTAAVGTNTTQLATTAFVQAEIANDAPAKDGTGATGTWAIAISGNAATATTLATARTINGVSFNGSANITVTASTTAALTGGSYITSAGTFDGATARTFAVDATSANTASKVVARDASGNFSAGTITAALTGTASGNLALTGGTLTGDLIGTQARFTDGFANSSINPGRGPIVTLGTITAGSGYVSGTYTGVALTGGTGALATATVVVTAGAVTSVTLTREGGHYIAGDVLSASAASLGGTGSGFSIPVSTVRTVGLQLYGATQNRIRLDSANTSTAAGSELGSILFCSQDNSAGGRGDKVRLIGVAEGTSGGGGLQIWTAANTAEPTLAFAFGGNNDFRAYNSAGTFYHAFSNSPTANRTVTFPDADVTLVAGTMVPTSGATMTGALLAATGSVSAPGIAFAGRTSTGLYSPAADTLAFVEGGAEVMRIDSSSRLLVGTSSSIVTKSQSNVAITPSVELAGTAISGSSQGLYFYGTAGTSSANLVFSRSNNITVGSHTVIGSGARMGGLIFTGSDGDEFIPGAEIFAASDAAAADNSMPGRLVFSTTADLAATPTERMRITSAGLVGIGTTAPATLLHLSSATGSATPTPTELRIATTSNASDWSTTDPWGRISFYSADTSDTGPKISAAIDASAWGSTTGGISALDFKLAASTTGTLTSRLYLSPNGNVGIGNTSPLGFLHIETPATTAGWQIRLDSVGLANESGFYRSATDNYEMVLRNGLGGLSYLTNTGGASTSTLEFNVQGSERARIDSAGRLLVGTSSARSLDFGASTAIPSLQVEGTSADTSSVSLIRNGATNSAGTLYFGKSRSATVGGVAVVLTNDTLGNINFEGADGAKLVEAASISAEVDGTPGLDDLPGRLCFNTTADGASSPTERLRITNDGVIAYNRSAPVAVNATTTLTIANLKTGIITSTSASATDMTLPTGTDTEAGFNGIYSNFTFEWSVINTGPSLVRVLAGTAHTVVGSGSVATGTSGRFASRRSAANAFITYRLS
jgi:hypothetical protein